MITQHTHRVCLQLPADPYLSLCKEAPRTRTNGLAQNTALGKIHGHKTHFRQILHTQHALNALVVGARRLVWPSTRRYPPFPPPAFLCDIHEPWAAAARESFCSVTSVNATLSLGNLLRAINLQAEFLEPHAHIAQNSMTNHFSAEKFKLI
jgi:hypothetical protein